MKKLLTSVAVATLFSFAANAQNAAPTANSTNTKTRTAQDWRNMPMDQKMQAGGAQMAEKENNLSAEERLKRKDEKSERSERREQRQEKYNNASPEEKARMDERRAVMEKLSPEKRAAVKAEMDRHRAAMKEITGVDLVPAGPQEMGGGRK